MALSLLKGNYVKFVRGTTALWNSLVTKDADTLYFIVDAGKAQGALYLGDILIAGNVDSVESALSKLADVNITEATVGDILVYNDETQKWENKAFYSVLSEIVKPMVGASADKDGAAGLVP